jgi:predicted AAA+ superfamily ATPase
MIKILTGTRRIGKSTILEQYQDFLKSKKINFINKNFNSLVEQSKNIFELNNEIIKASKKDEINYIFFDEIQLIKDFQKLVISLFESKEFKYDIYITGSNSRMFSSELSTLFTGRNFEKNILPISFLEVQNYFNEEKNSFYNKYLIKGGMGKIISIYKDNDTLLTIKKIVEDIINKDIIKKYRIKNILPFKNIINYVFNHIGKEISANNLENYLISNNEPKVSKKTILEYFKYLEETFLIIRLRQYNIKGKKLLLNKYKYYSNDLGILSSFIGNDKNYLYSFRMENLVLLYLLDNNFEVFSSTSELDIDFIAKKDDKLFYIQVTKELNDDNYDREIKKMISIKDSYKKIVICENNLSINKKDGVEIFNILELLTNEKFI